MKRHVILFLLTTCLINISNGQTAHQTVAAIAENHLSPKAKTVIQELLGGQSLVDVSNWADEVLVVSDYEHTAQWHFSVAPFGLKFDGFQAMIDSQDDDKLYGALLENEYTLLRYWEPKQKRAAALKFVVNLMSDLHQPLSLRSDGKTAAQETVQFNGSPTTLQALWDSTLLDSTGSTVKQLAFAYDQKATPEDITKWQSGGPMEWFWESYQLRTTLYNEIKKGRKIDTHYYELHKSVAAARLVKAGVRLAAVLNEVLKGGRVNGTLIPPPRVKEFIKDPPAVKN